MIKRLILIISLCFLPWSIVYAQISTITGTVYDYGDKQPISGATVMVTGTTLGVSTDANGQFTINRIPASAKTIKVSLIGMVTQTHPIRDVAYKIYLKEDTQMLDEVVIQVAYGAATKASVTGAISTVDTKSIENRPVSNVSSILEGASTGVQVHNSYGEPGKAADIRIRGFGSVNGVNSPLIVLDGVAFQGSMSDINPNDIDNVSILKDAASAALFGNRAANGVILITTKKGRSDKVDIRINVNQGIYNRGMPEYNSLGADDFMEVMWTGYRNNLMSDLPESYPTFELANEKANRSMIDEILVYNIYNKANDQLFDANGKLVPDARILPGYKGDLDWYKPLERTGHRQEYNMSGSAAGDKGNYYFSAGYLDEKGYIKSSDFQRLTARANVNLTPTKWFKTGITLSGTHQKMNETNGSASSSSAFSNPFMFARQMAPIYPVYLHDPATGEFILDSNNKKQYDDGSMGLNRPQYNGRHIVWESNLNSDNTIRNTLNGQLYGDIKFLRDFTFTVRGTLGLINTEQREYNNAIIGDGAGSGRSQRTIYRRKEYTFQQQLDWNRVFGKHHINVLLGHENYSYSYNYLNNFKTDEIFENNIAFINFTQMGRMNDYLTDYRTESYLSRVRYNYDERYYGEFSIRRDGSSRFHKDNRWGNFWSLGGSWLISRERFMEPLRNVFNSLKLRVSYGEVGNDASVGYYGYMDMYRLTQNKNLGAAYKSQLEARKIKWETAQAIGVALEGRMFDRFNFTLEYFDKRSKDLLFDVNLPLSLGANSTGTPNVTVSQNIGTVSNRGFEMNADVDIIANRHVTWNFGMNTTFIRNVIKKLPPENREKGILSGTKKYVEGGGVYDFWLPNFIGVDQMTGRSLYEFNDDEFYTDKSSPEADKKLAEPESIEIINGKVYSYDNTHAKKDWAGSAIPKWYGSFNTSVSWKGFTLSALFTYAVGGKVLDNNYKRMMSVGASPTALHKNVLKSWNGIPEGMTLDSPDRINSKILPSINYKHDADNNVTSNRFLRKGDYFTIKNVSLAYKFPKSITDKMTIKDLSIILTGENLYTFSNLKGMDPQQSFSGVINNAFVTARVFSLGVNFTF